MDIQHGRRKPFDIEHVVVNEENINEVAEWCGGTVGGTEEGERVFIKLTDKNAINTRQTRAYVGDVVVRHVELNTFKSFGVKSFNKSYEVLSTQQVARDAGTGEYTTLEAAQADPEGTVIETNTHLDAIPVDLPRDADPS